MRQRGGIEHLELLAPAGGMEQLEYAVRFGADAVYLACDRFGLRQRAENFSLAEVPAAVQFAHDRGVQVFVTCNAYMNAEDLTLLPEYFEALAAARVDAFIVSDLGALRLAKRHAPQVAIHVSTQAACTNAEAALTWYDLGARRIVCAREMSVEDIATMRQAVPDDLELEVFVQGAMCMAISGRCLISDYMTGRSANRGHCTQPCRWEYTLREDMGGSSEVDSAELCHREYSLRELTRPDQDFPIEEDARGTYIMNSKDLCMLAHLDDLAAAGVDSIKIEGRNKKAFYVATMVNAYRQVLDGADPALLMPELDTVSHRPYSTGFFYGPAEQTGNADVYLQAYDWVAEVIETNVPETGDEKSTPAVNSKAQKEAPASNAEAQEGAPVSNSKAQEENPASNAEAQEEASAINAEVRVHVICRNRFYEGDTLEVLSPHSPIRQIIVRDLRREFDGGANEPAKVANRAMDRYSFATDPSLADRQALATDLSLADMQALATGLGSADMQALAAGLGLASVPPLMPYDILRVKRIDPSCKN